MAYQTALTIESVIKDIDSKKYLLPSIQREFVWSTGQIEKLFDSLMRDYPINAFLFWKVPREKVSEFKFYEFLRDYHQKDNKHNPKANTNGTEDIIAILDGQQRMTSLYIALKGTYAYKMSYKRWDNPAAYPRRKLYLNLLAASEDADMFYDFLFLTEDEAKNIKNDHDEYEGSFWFPVGKILDFREESDVNDYLIDNDLNTVADKAQAKFANKALFKLYSVIHNKQTISYYLEESTELDKVLNIFIRVNSGGTTLSYYSLRAPYRNKAVWLLNDSTVKAIRKLKDGNGNYIWQPSVREGEPDRILNRPYRTSIYVPELAAGNRVMAFGDYSYYWIADRQGRSFKRLNELYATTGQVGFLASERVDGKLILSEAVKTLDVKAAGK